MDETYIQRSLRDTREKLEVGDCRSAYELLMPLVSEGNSEALFLYSTFSLPEMEADEDFDERRVRLLQVSSNSGYVPAIYELAVCYDIGDLVETDPVKASALYKRAAEAGHSKAKLNHGLDLYYGSNGMPQGCGAGH